MTRCTFVYFTESDHREQYSYNTSHKICIRFWCALFCFGYIISSERIQVVFLPTIQGLQQGTLLLIYINFNPSIDT